MERLDTTPIDPTKIDEKFDVIVIGAGIAGNVEALSLSAQGLKVLLIEHRSHPRFVIGESTIPSTSAGFKKIGQRYGIPELAELTTYIKSKQMGLISYPKCHFYFAHHTVGEPLKKEREMCFETYRMPLGPDTHLERATLDTFLNSLCPKYGVDYRDQVTVRTLEAGDVDRPARLRVRDKDVVKTFEASIIVDATGHAAFGARVTGLLPSEGSDASAADASRHGIKLQTHNAFSNKHANCELHTHTRATYGHFEFDPEKDNLDKACGGPTNAFRYRRDAGTMHHVFDGGWIWIIPFDNNTVSVGLVLNCIKHPYDASIDKDVEFWSFINRFPTVKAHLGGLKPTRQILRRGRIQLRAKAIMIGRMLITPHANSFIDALFSTGINLTTRFILRSVPRIVDALKGKQVTSLDVPNLFAPMQKAFDLEVNLIDKMVWGNICAFRHFELFRQYWRIWIDGTTRQIVDIHVHENTEAPLYGAGNAVSTIDETNRPSTIDSRAGCFIAVFRSPLGQEQWRKTVDAAFAVVTEVPNGVTPPPEEDFERAKRVKAILDALPSRYDHYPMKAFAPDWSLQFPHRTNVMVPLHTASMMKAVSGSRTRLQVTWDVICALTTLTLFHLHYIVSVLLSTSFHRHVDVVNRNVLPTKGLMYQAKVFYYAMLALFTGKNINKMKNE